MARTHVYDVTVTWTGDRGTGTSGASDYDRSHDLTADGPPPIPGSAHPPALGDPTRWNPEQLLTAALSQCHMLWFLHLSSLEGIVVTDYTDTAHGEMEEHREGGRFTSVTLRPHVTVTSADMTARTIALHHRAHDLCFIASSVNFPVICEPKVTTTGEPE